MTVLILMATYNGAAFVEAQLRSIQAQTHADWQLLVRDDASSDATPVILRTYAAADPRIAILNFPAGRLGVRRNFSALIAEAAVRGADYVAFSDQDDVWRADKLARQVEAMAALETQYGADLPCLVHSDLAVVDSALQPIHPSFVRYQGIACPDRPPALTCLVQNHVVGCTILANCALLQIASPVPAGIHLHDWWFGLCGRFAGATHFIPEPLVRYRQHRANRIGARGISGLLAQPRRWLGWLGKMACLYRHAWFQARQLQSRLPVAPASDLPALSLTAARSSLDAFVALADRARPVRLWGLLRRGVRAQHPALTGLLYAQSLLLDASGHESHPAFEEGCRERR